MGPGGKESEETALLNVKGDEAPKQGQKMFPDLLPGGDICYLVPVEDDTYCCGLLEHNPEWTALWADPCDLRELILSIRAVELHVPWIYEDAVNKVASWFEEYEDTARPAKHNTAHVHAESGNVCRGFAHKRSQRKAAWRRESERFIGFDLAKGSLRA